MILRSHFSPINNEISPSFLLFLYQIIDKVPDYTPLSGGGDEGGDVVNKSWLKSASEDELRSKKQKFQQIRIGALAQFWMVILMMKLRLLMPLRMS